MYDQDPWGWVNQQKQVAPLSAQLQPSTEQPPPIQVVKDPGEQYFGQAMMGKGIDAAAKGIDAGIKAYSAPLSQTATAANTLGQGATLANVGASTVPASTYALTPTLTAAPLGGAGLGIGQAAASTIGAGLGETALGTAATTAAAPAAATTAGLGAAGAAGGEAALAAMGPVGWAIGAGLLAHKLGIF